MEGGDGDDRNWSMWLRLLLHSVRDTADDTFVFQAVKNLQQLCSKGEQKGDLVARDLPALDEDLQPVPRVLVHSETSTELLLLAVLQFFVDLSEPTSLSS